MRELHLFAGAGGGIWGGQLLGHTTVCAVEINPYCRKVIAARQADGTFPTFPVHDDVHTFDGRPWRGKVDIVCGGFPCTPWSVAGKRQGKADPRHLWPEFARIVEECEPAYVFAENVSLDAFREPWADLRRMGYRVPPAIQVGARDVGAPHRRNRWWLLAAHPDADRHGQQGQPAGDGADGRMAVEPRHDADGLRLDVADACAPRLQAPEQTQLCGTGRRHEGRAVAQRSWWATEPRVGRVAHGVPSRCDRLRALGNAQVPLVAATAFRLLMDGLTR